MELLEIEKELSGENRDHALERYDAQLIALSDRLSSAMRGGMLPEEFAKCEALGEAVVIARKLLRLQVRNAKNN